MQRKPVVRFTALEAREKVGQHVRSLTEFAGVPKGTPGVVVDVHQFENDGFDVVVQWDLAARQSSHDRFAKGPYEEFLCEESPKFAVAV